MLLKPQTCSLQSAEIVSYLAKFLTKVLNFASFQFISWISIFFKLKEIFVRSFTVEIVLNLAKSFNKSVKF